jgi:hypothetical protein
MQKFLLEREQKIKEDWVLALDNLTNQIKQWLSEEEHKLIKINKIFIEKFEEHIGNYIAPMLVITKENAKVEIRPIGRFAIGAIGRVDMANNSRSHTFLFSNKKGWISLENRKPLNEDLFFKYLDDMLQN